MPDGDEYLYDPAVREKDRLFPYEPPRTKPTSARYVKRGGDDYLTYVPPAELAGLDFVPFGADGVGHPGYRPDPPPPLPAAEAERIEQAAADVLLDRTPAAIDPEDLNLLREAWAMSHTNRRKPGESLAERLVREARELADKKATEKAAAEAKCEREALEANTRASRLFDQLRSLEGTWLGNVPHLAYGAGGSSRIDRYRGQLVVRLYSHAVDRGGLKLTRHGVRVLLHHPNTVSMRLVEWVTGWVNPRGNSSNTLFHTAGWVIDDYNTPMSDRLLLVGQNPRTEEAAVEQTLDLLRKFVIPEPPPPPPVEPTVEATRPGLDL